jgi:Myb-like DNA-binding protein BAS1
MLIAAVDAQKIRSRISWKEISKEITGRSEKQCRERYMDYLNPSIDHSDWETFEDEIILKGQRELGNRWKDICKLITHKNRGAASVKVVDSMHLVVLISNLFVT